MRGVITYCSHSHTYTISWNLVSSNVSPFLLPPLLARFGSSPIISCRTRKTFPNTSSSLCPFISLQSHGDPDAFFLNKSSFPFLLFVPARPPPSPVWVLRLSHLLLSPWPCPTQICSPHANQKMSILCLRLLTVLLRIKGHCQKQ